MSADTNYPIGTPGQPWDEEDKMQWLNQQQIQRSYLQEVLSKLNDVPAGFTMVQYGSLPYDDARYPLFVAKPTRVNAELPNILVTGGVHGYETSGVQGALRFLLEHASSFLSEFNLFIAPCISPWGYETINRWNPATVDPNRSFTTGSASPEAQAIMAFVADQELQLLAHIDLHETTDTDNSEFRPALAARDGIEQDNWTIPDGFYTVGNSRNPQPEFQKAIIDSVEKVTHIAPADKHGKIIGADVAQKGVINYDKKSLFLCGGFTNADYVSTTEVYPDSPKTDPENCIQAQVAAIVGGLNYLQSI